MDNFQGMKFTPDHEWVRMENGLAVVGITQHAQEALGDIVYVELPKVGDKVKAGKSFGVVESTKTTSDLFAPLSGEIAEINESLGSAPETINAECYGAGWIVKITPANAAELDGLMDHDAYKATLT